MQDSARGSAAARERASVEGSNVSAKSRSRRRWSDEEKARVVRESLRPGKRVGEVARRYGVSRWQLSTWAQRRPPRRACGGVVGAAGDGRLGAAAGVRRARGGQRERSRSDWVGLDRGARSDGACRRRDRRVADRGDRLGAAGASMNVAGTGMRVVVATRAVDCGASYSGIGGAIPAAQPDGSCRDIFSVTVFPLRVYLNVSLSSPARV